jgi:tetratricopeptide (TPR) repeat protein
MLNRFYRLLLSEKQWAFGCPILLCLIVGCAAQQPVGKLQQADGFFEDGNYARALTDYRIALAHDLSPGEEERARYRMGAAYYHMKAYADAGEALGEYLDAYPHGAYRPEARNLLREISKGWESRQQERAKEYQELVTQIRELEKEASSTAENASAHYQLADLYWRAGMWEESAEQYRLAMLSNPSYETDSVVVGRVKMSDDGRVVPRIPVVTSDIFGNEGPLRIENAKSQVVSELDYRGESRIFLVSGDVVNQSVRSYEPVTVQVSILDFEDRVINSRVVRLGRLESGERRRFDVRLLVYGSPINITRYECKLMYRR